MKTETINQVQAYLDDELPAAERAEVESLLNSDAEVEALFHELTETRDWLKDGELPRAVPENREFYWSKIAREIEREELPHRRREDQSERTLGDWLRWVLPAMGLVIIMLLAITNLSPSGNGGSGGQPEKAASYHEVDNPLESGSLITFRSNSEGVTVVWISGE